MILLRLECSTYANNSEEEDEGFTKKRPRHGMYEGLGECLWMRMYGFEGF